MGKLRSKLLCSKVGSINTVIYIFNRGVIPLVYFVVFRLFSFGKHVFPSFFGKGCYVINTRYLKTGKNFYLGSYSYFDCLSLGGVEIGDNVTIRENAWLQLTSRLDNPGHSIKINDNTYIGPRSIIGGAATICIGYRCQIGANVSLIAENHQFDNDNEIINQGVTRKGIVVGDDCWIGNNVIILDGVEIGSGCVIGAGAVVTKSFSNNSVIVGNPARLLKSRNLRQDSEVDH